MFKFCTNWGQRSTYSNWWKFPNLHDTTFKSITKRGPQSCFKEFPSPQLDLGRPMVHANFACTVSLFKSRKAAKKLKKRHPKDMLYIYKFLQTILRWVHRNHFPGYIALLVDQHNDISCLDVFHHLTLLEINGKSCRKYAITKTRLLATNYTQMGNWHPI